MGTIWEMKKRREKEKFIMVFFSFLFKRVTGVMWGMGV